MILVEKSELNSFNLSVEIDGNDCNTNAKMAQEN